MNKISLWSFSEKGNGEGKMIERKGDKKRSTTPTTEEERSFESVNF